MTGYAPLPLMAASKFSALGAARDDRYLFVHLVCDISLRIQDIEELGKLIGIKLSMERKGTVDCVAYLARARTDKDEWAHQLRLLDGLQIKFRNHVAEFVQCLAVKGPSSFYEFINFLAAAEFLVDGRQGDFSEQRYIKRKLCGSLSPEADTSGLYMERQPRAGKDRYRRCDRLDPGCCVGTCSRSKAANARRKPYCQNPYGHVEADQGQDNREREQLGIFLHHGSPVGPRHLSAAEGEAA